MAQGIYLKILAWVLRFPSLGKMNLKIKASFQNELLDYKKVTFSPIATRGSMS